MKTQSHMHLANNFSQVNWVKVYAKTMSHGQGQLLSHRCSSIPISHVRNSKAYNSVISERKHKVWVFIFFVRT